MKLNQIALAVATLAAAPAAFALTPAQVDSSTVRLWLSGASAPTASVYKGVLTLCQGMTYKDALGVTHTNPGTPDAHLYLESASAGKLPGSAGDRMAYVCTVSTDDNRAGSLEGKKVVVFHTVEGGSFNYVTPHLSIAGEINPNLPGKLSRTSNIPSLDDTTTECANPAAVKTGVRWDGSAIVAHTNAAGDGEPVVVELSGLNNNVSVYRGCAITEKNFSPSVVPRIDATLDPEYPEGGFSDTEYVINKLNLDVTTDISAIGSEVPTNIGQAFGAAVSYPLYFQLQKNDIAALKIAATCDDAPFTSVSPNLTGACQPNLAASTYTAIANKDNIAFVDGTLFGAVATPPGTSHKIQFERRAITSGTQSASNLRFLNKPCAIGVAGGALNPARSAVIGDPSRPSYTNVDVAENSSTGGVKTGLTAATTANEFGLGWVSMENVPGSSEKWAFVKLDGVSPNFTATGAADAKQRANAIDGTYTAWYELVALTAGGDNVKSPATLEGVDLIAAVNTSLGNPGITDLTGLFITPVAGVTGSNVGKTARAGNSCQPAF